MNPQVSIIVPNYNHHKYLDKRLGSIFNQTYQNFEVLILDDCSTDKSKEILDGYKTNPKVKSIIFNEKNSGTSYKQWYKGIEYASGELIWIAETDDYADYRFLETLTKFFEDPDVALVYCNSNYVYEDRIENIDSSLTNTHTVFSGNQFIKSKLIFRNHIYNASMVIFRRSRYEYVKNNGYSMLRLCGDWLLWTQIIRNNKLVQVHDKLNYFRQHNFNTTSRYSKQGLDIIEGLLVLDEGRSLFAKDERAVIYSNLFSFYNELKSSYNLKTKLLVHLSILRNDWKLTVYMLNKQIRRIARQLINLTRMKFKKHNLDVNQNIQ